MKNILIIVCVALLFYQCEKNQPNSNDGINTIWRMELGDSRLTNSMRPIVHENRIIYSKRLDGENKIQISCFNKQTGEFLWNWNNALEFHTLLPSSKTAIINDKFIMAMKGTIYVLNIDDGSTHWIEQIEESGNNDIWRDDHGMAYMLNYSNSPIENIVYKIDIENKIATQIYTQKLNGYDDIFMRSLVPFDSNGKSYIAFHKGNYMFSPSVNIDSIVLVNLTDNIIEYTKEANPISDFLVGFNLSTDANQNLYYSGKNMYCRNALTGELKWSKTIPIRVDAHGYLQVNDKIYLHSNEPKMYAFDANNGTLLWTAPSIQTGSLMAHHNGIIYFTAGDNLIHAIDINTQEYLWEHAAPFRCLNDSWFFEKVVTIDPETGLLYTGDYHHALCLETIR